MLGKESLQRVRDQITNLDALKEHIQSISPGGNYSSCDITAKLVASFISNGKNVPYTVPPHIPNRQEKFFSIINMQLSNPSQMLYIRIVPDHHFVVFPYNAGQIVILQAFEGVYNLFDWINSDKVIIKRHKFIRCIDRIITKKPQKQICPHLWLAERKNAACELFACNQTQRSEIVNDLFKGGNNEVGISYIHACPLRSPSLCNIL